MAWADDCSSKNLVEKAASVEDFSTLVAAVKAAGLVEALQGDGPFTVFAPTNDAFAALPEGTVESLLKPENKQALVDILKYHVVSGAVPAKTAVTLSEAKALNGETIQVMLKGEKLFLNESQVVKTDIMTSNGIIHVIDKVLLPPKKDVSQVPGGVKRVMQAAIQRGAPLYNKGQHSACAEIYEVAAISMLQMPEGELTAGQRKTLQVALAKSDGSHCATTNAWTMRHALDAVGKMAAN